MFPSPLDIPASVDCVVLAETGVDALFPLIFGLIVVVLGVAFFAFSRGRLRRSGVALGLVLLLAGGGAGLAIAAPATSAQADDCTPLDYQLDAETESPATIPSGGTVIIEFWVTDVVDRDGTPPIVVSIPKAVTYNTPVLTVGDNWTFDDTNADSYLFTYAGPLPKDTTSSIAGFTFNISNGNSSSAHYDIPVTIVTGSGGDTVESNNSVTVSVDVDGIVG